MSGDAPHGELVLKIWLQSDLYGVHQRDECMRTRQYMEEVQGEPGNFDSWRKCWTLGV